MRIPNRRTVRFASMAACILAAVLVGSGCRKSEDGISISGDVEGLDTLGLRGAALLAQSDSMPGTIDSLRAVAEGRLARSHESRPAGEAVTPPAARGVIENPMAERAKVLADSMVRASAQQYAVGSGGALVRRDTVRGIVTVVGADPVRQVVLRTVHNPTIFTMSGMATSGLSRLEGVELVVRGLKVSPRDIVVTDYFVRAANGVPAFDGTLVVSEGVWYLQMSDGSGRKRIGDLPSALRSEEGERVWIAVSPTTNTVQAFGVIPRR